ncbi:hypothetical protein [Hydrogenophaga sp. IBVHS2]|uniref:hypothetical protein n=1 Tax=Hydrogenophaga sp. IBVHS2 TaxID=1985170 RepID=UPI00117A73C2|nr:hypothetical protein [Hydrogenophaga sp. IBVHS2]
MSSISVGNNKPGSPGVPSASRLVAMGNGCKKVFKAVRNQFRDLAEEAVQEPVNHTLNESDSVRSDGSSHSEFDGNRRISAAEADGNVKPPAEQLLTPDHDVVPPIDPDRIVRYAGQLMSDVVGSASESRGLAWLLPNVPESGSVDPALSTAIHEVARSHAKVVTEGLPHDLGLDPDVVHNWFLNECNPASAAVDLKRFLTTQLQAKGHGPQVADWLYQQMLAAGSTCMTALALDEGKPGLCRQYGHAAIREITDLAQHFNTQSKATALIGGWKQSAGGSRTAEEANRCISAVKTMLERQWSDTGNAVPTKTKKKETIFSCQYTESDSSSNSVDIRAANAKPKQVLYSAAEAGQKESVVRKERSSTSEGSGRSTALGSAERNLKREFSRSDSQGATSGSESDETEQSLNDTNTASVIEREPPKTTEPRDEGVKTKKSLTSEQIKSDRIDEASDRAINSINAIQNQLTGDDSSRQ